MKSESFLRNGIKNGEPTSVRQIQVKPELEICLLKIKVAGIIRKT